ncbi:hypothetical protein F2P81_008208 [Scophthalmus maximus]|uniref:Uncharacterized protein n=1 Tax=Scophthalmus maximus TaxID=52904 RepID=A0A6A4T1N3_SCOMX|nr:hypothetical protein F2P81_008208 [Scophthalmus maximus]
MAQRGAAVGTDTNILIDVVTDSSGKRLSHKSSDGQRTPQIGIVEPSRFQGPKLLMSASISHLCSQISHHLNPPLDQLTSDLPGERAVERLHHNSFIEDVLELQTRISRLDCKDFLDARKASIKLQSV